MLANMPIVSAETANVGSLLFCRPLDGVAAQFRRLGLPHCLLAGDGGALQGRWTLFSFHRTSCGMGGVSGEVRIAAVERALPDQHDTVAAALVADELLARWWPASLHVRPPAPGRYLATPDIALLLDAIGPAGEPCAGGRAMAEARAQALLCATLDAWRAATLVACDDGAAIDPAERRCLAAARAMIESRYAEKLTIDGIARACGIGRARLIRGMRLVYGTSVADLLAERRLSRAAAKLRATDLPVARIAFDSGYRSNAAFTRAFVRRYGRAPTLFRAEGGAAAD